MTSTTPELREIEVDGLRVAYVDVGEGEPIVMLHGYPQSHETWRHQIAELSTTHRVVAIDWPGWGRSERSLEQSTTYDQEIARLGRVLDALKLSRCNLFAHDYGGYIALGFMLAHPDRVSRFAILNSRAHETFPRVGYWGTWLPYACARIMPSLFRRLPLEKIHRLGLEPYEAAGCMDHALVDRYVGWMAEQPGRRWLTRFFSDYSLRPRREQLPALAKLRVPTAVIWGVDDPWCPLEIGSELAAAMPDATLTTIEHGLHFVMEHKPAEVTTALRALLAREAAAPDLRAPAMPPPTPSLDSVIYRNAIIAGWAWTVCGVLVLLGMAGLFTENIGPLGTNQTHALVLNLAVGLFGFAFARFELERVFVLVGGITMVVVSLAGFIPATQTWMYETFNLNATSSWAELASGIASFLIWLVYHPRKSLPITPSGA